MHRYSLFGGCLHSDLEMPGLPVSSSPDATWRLTVEASRSPAAAGPLLGSEEVDPGCTVRLHAQPGGLRLAYDDTGAFDILEAGSRIVWYPAPGPVGELARLDVIGRVMAAALHLGGSLALHGSAVAIDGRAVAFVAPKTFGKSTLACALVNAGATFISDDTLPVEPNATPHVRPGVDHVRLRDDAARRLLAAERLATEASCGKHVIHMAVAEPSSRTPLAAVYLLVPSAPSTTEPAPAARRVRLTTVAATIALVRHAKLGGLAGGPEAARLLDRAGHLAQTVPVYRLEVERDLGRLPGAVAEIFGWHLSHAPAHADGAIRAPRLVPAPPVETAPPVRVEVVA